MYQLSNKLANSVALGWALFFLLLRVPMSLCPGLKIFIRRNKNYCSHRLYNTIFMCYSHEWRFFINAKKGTIKNAAHYSSRG